VYPAIGLAAEARRTQRLALHLLLLFITVLTTSAMGARLADNFERNRPVSADDLLSVTQIFTDPASLVRGLPFSITLLTILLAHEMGHYLTCVYYRIDASLPYFLPSPLLIGTFGAFIRIRSPITTKRSLFDIGVAGPVAGFVLVVPLMAIGLAYSKIIPNIGLQGDINFSVPLLQRLLERVVFPSVSANDILLHPIGRAAWFGAFATALNLLPIGQLDGGHILYSFAGAYHKPISRVFALALVPMGFLYSWSWLFWAALLLFFIRHPRIYDEEPLGWGRTKLALLAAAMLILCFTATPIRT
jgi:membrane-associated protease RseP (regulator of RpoE activity)